MTGLDVSGEIDLRNGQITRSITAQLSARATIPNSCLRGLRCIEFVGRVHGEPATEKHDRGLDFIGNIYCREGADACRCQMALELPSALSSVMSYEQDGTRIRADGSEGETVTYDVCVRGDRMTLLEEDEFILRMVRRPEH